MTTTLTPPMNLRMPCTNCGALEGVPCQPFCKPTPVKPPRKVK